MSVVLNGNTYGIDDFVGTDGRGYAETFAATGLQVFPESIFTDMLAELAAVPDFGGLSYGAAGGIMVSSGSAWVRAASATITDAGAATFTSLNATGTINLSKAVPRFQLAETGVTADNGNWDILCDTEVFEMRAYNDADSVGQAWVRVNRTGTTIDSVAFPEGNVFISDSANANMTLGLTINQGANDDEILAFKSSDVAHGMTSVAETDTYGTLMKAAALAGGVKLTGLRDADGTAGQALILQGNLGEAADTTKTTAALGIIQLNSRIKNGTTTQTVGADGNLAVITNNNTTRFIFDAEGDSHQDVGTAWTNFDDRDDAMMTRSLGIYMDRASVIESRWDDFGRDHYEDMVSCGLIPRLTPTEVARGERGLVNTTQVMRLHNGAIWQNAVSIKDGRERQEAIEDCLRTLVTANPTFEGRTEALALLEAA